MTVPSCAVILAVPADWPVTIPLALMEATLLAEELHVTAVEMPCVVPSLNVPVALYASVDAGASTADAGLRAIETSVAELTFKGVEPVVPFNVALIVVVPAPTAVAVPLAPLPIVATLLLLDAHVTSRVMFWVLESLNKPVAVKDSLVAGAMVWLEGTTEIDAMLALLTSRVTELVREPRVAVIVVMPGLRPFAKPGVEPRVATAVLDEDQVSWLVSGRVPPSLKVPTA